MLLLQWWFSLWGEKLTCKSASLALLRKRSVPVICGRSERVSGRYLAGPAFWFCLGSGVWLPQSGLRPALRQQRLFQGPPAALQLGLQLPGPGFRFCLTATCLNGPAAHVCPSTGHCIGLWACSSERPVPARTSLPGQNLGPGHPAQQGKCFLPRVTWGCL